MVTEANEGRGYVRDRRARKNPTYRGMGDPAASHACIKAEPEGDSLEI
jgi:hypothetical protein